MLTYGGGRLDRAGARRGDPEWVGSVLARPETTLVPLWRDRCLVVDGTGPVRHRAGEAGELLAAAGEVVLLGLDDTGTAVFAVDLSGLDEERARELTGTSAAVDVRAIVGALSPAEAAVQAYARGLLHWHRQQRFCGACGAAAGSAEAGHARRCSGPACGRLLFPRIEPAVLVLVELPGPPARCLLARHAGATADGWSTLAGFVEVGESLEDAVRREVAEEAGVVVTEVAYQGSQAWPFPAGLMTGFRATAASDRIRVDGVELVEARWFTRAELRERAARGALGRPDAIDHRLLRDWSALD